MAKEKSGSGPGEVILPSEEELAALPRRARIAFAGRCARRVQPLFKHFWPDAPQEHVDAIDRAITLVERSAVSPVSTSDLKEASAAADAACVAADATFDEHSSAFVAHAAARAADTAAGAGLAAHPAHSAHAAASDIGEAYDAAFSSAFSTECIRSTGARIAMRRDYELLKAAAEREQWTDDTPVPPQFFGPLWPDGEPDGWPVKEIELDSEPVELVIEMDVPDDADDEEVAERIREVVAEMDGMHRAMGGGGLKIAGVDVDVETGIREGVPS